MFSIEFYCSKSFMPVPVGVSKNGHDLTLSALITAGIHLGMGFFGFLRPKPNKIVFPSWSMITFKLLEQESCFGSQMSRSVENVIAPP